MTVRQQGASYDFQAQIQLRDRVLGGALDDIASQVQAVAQQVKAPTSGSPQTPPSAPTALSVVAAGGYATATVSDNGADSAVTYQLQYSAAPNFTNSVTVDLGAVPQFHGYLHGLTLYFRVAAKYATSALSGWTYYGTASAPTSLVI